MESGDGGSSDIEGSWRETEIGSAFKGEVGNWLMGLGVASLSGSLGDTRGVIVQTCTKFSAVYTLEKG